MTRLSEKEELEKVYFEIHKLWGEIDCRIEHGANSNGHLEFVRNELTNIKHLIDDLLLTKL